jgi:sulfide:quinone oxidoreductase
MIFPKNLDLNVAVSGQVQVADLPEIALNFGMLINNRPDGEEPGQPTSAELEAAARSLGLHYAYIPISADIADQDVAAFQQELSRSRGAKLAFCRTGNRSTRLWALSQAGRRSTKRILAAAAIAGYDISSLEPRLIESAAGK